MGYKSALVEPGLRAMHFAQTIGAVRKFDAQIDPERSTDGEEFFRMRSAMDLSPGAGKRLSRLGIRQPQGGVPTVDQARSSTFLAFEEIDQCVSGLQANGVYVFKSRLPEDMIARMRQSALEVPSMARGLDRPAIVANDFDPP